MRGGRKVVFLQHQFEKPDVKTYLASVLFGLLAGVTDFAPVSSTVHLHVIAAMFCINLADRFWRMYIVASQLGAIAGFVLFYVKRSGLRRQELSCELRSQLVLKIPSIALIAWACLTTAFSSLLLYNLGFGAVPSPKELGKSVALGGIAMWVVDSLPRRASSKNSERITVLQAFCVGACQTLSIIFPGVSRAMATITSGQLSGMTRQAAVEFSYLIFVPTTLAETFLELHQIQSTGHYVKADGKSMLILGVGFVTSALAAYVSTGRMLKWVHQHGLLPFAIYSLCLGLLLLAPLPWHF